jgi:lambda family phage portal protein
MVGQIRGLPWFATASWRMKMLSGYEDAGITAARMGAMTAAVIETPSGDDFQGTDTEVDGVKVLDLEPGTMPEIPEGTKFHEYDPTYPHQQFEPFVSTMLRGVAAALGVSHASLSNDLTKVNYSSARIGLGDERDHWKRLQRGLRSNLVQPVFERWLRIALMSRKLISDRSLFLPLDLEDKFRRAHWQPRRWPAVDPLKERQAQAIALELKLTSRARIISESGEDPDEIWEEIEAEEARIGPVSEAVAVAAAQPVPDEDDDANNPKRDE